MSKPVWVDGKIHVFTVAVQEWYWTVGASSGQYHYVRHVLAHSYAEALDECREELARAFAQAPAERMRFRVHVGLTHNPSCFAGRLDGKLLDRNAADLKV